VESFALKAYPDHKIILKKEVRKRNDEALFAAGISLPAKDL